jgi:hypothetical protein
MVGSGFFFGRLEAARIGTRAQTASLLQGHTLSATFDKESRPSDFTVGSRQRSLFETKIRI